MTAKPFPTFRSHDEASCFNCGGDFGPDGWWSEDGRAPGYGQFNQHCCKCDMRTWYDLTKKAA